MTPTIDSGDTAFVLFSAALVLLMTPGLAFFYGGLVRKKSVLNTMLMSFVAMSLVGVLWVVVGYSLAFSPGYGSLAPFLGGFHWVGLSGVGAEPNADYAATVPHTAFMLFQCMFAVITPALISGAVVERMKFSSYLVFIAIWSLLVYAPVAHWVWAPEGFLRKFGALDFAGGVVVHVNAGVAALVAAKLIGPRIGFGKAAMPPHNVPFALLGTGLLWFGWLGFNGGSALAANGLAGSAFVATFIAAAAAGFVYSAMEIISHGKATGVGLATGIVAGLVAITPASGFVGPMASVVIGGLGATVAYFAIKLRPRVLGVDDALDVFGVHGMAGLFGSLATGVFASLAVNSAGADGLLAGNAKLLWAQLVAVSIPAVWSALASYGVLKILDKTMGLRAVAESESEGLDLSENGEGAYGDAMPSGALQQHEAPPAQPAAPSLVAAGQEP